MIYLMKSNISEHLCSLWRRFRFQRCNIESELSPERHNEAFTQLTRNTQNICWTKLSKELPQKTISRHLDVMLLTQLYEYRLNTAHSHCNHM